MYTHTYIYGGSYCVQCEFIFPVFRVVLLRMLNSQLIIIPKTINTFHHFFSTVFFSAHKQIRLPVWSKLSEPHQDCEFRAWMLLSLAGTSWTNISGTHLKLRLWFSYFHRKWHFDMEMSTTGRSHAVWLFSLYSIIRHGGSPRFGMDKAGNRSKSDGTQQNHFILCCFKPCHQLAEVCQSWGRILSSL